jgi:hypothetical protein
MPSKKELMERIVQLEAQVRRLENMHARIVPANSWQSTRFAAPDPFENYIYDGKEGIYCGRQLTAAELKARYEHPLTKERTAWTRRVSGVTHEELAQYVLDGTPIKRNQAMPAAKIEYTPTETKFQINMP